jgi:hypothetical protein
MSDPTPVLEPELADTREGTHDPHELVLDRN